eukprot:3420386-Pleurochrysis_carterae.AAC.2
MTKAHCAAGRPEAAEAQLLALMARGQTIDAVALCTVMNAYVSRQPPNIAAALALMEGASHTQSRSLFLLLFGSDRLPNPSS